MKTRKEIRTELVSFYHEVIDSNVPRPIFSLVFALVFEFKEKLCFFEIQNFVTRIWIRGRGKSKLLPSWITFTGCISFTLVLMKSHLLLVLWKKGNKNCNKNYTWKKKRKKKKKKEEFRKAFEIALLMHYKFHSYMRWHIVIGVK